MNNGIASLIPSRAKQSVGVHKLLSFSLPRLDYYTRRVDTFLFYSRIRAIGAMEIDQIFSFTTRKELRKLYELAHACPPNSFALEIGSHLGASSCYIAAGLAHNNGHLFCVDTWQNETMPDGVHDTFAEFHRNTYGLRQYITAVRKHSENLNNDDIATPLSLVFIDGDHSYDAVKGDFTLVSQWLSDDGVIAFHDCLFFEGVVRTVGEALASGKWVLHGQVENLCWLKRAHNLK